jgi:hypothetical protein
MESKEIKVSSVTKLAASEGATAIQVEGTIDGQAFGIAVTFQDDGGEIDSEHTSGMEIAEEDLGDVLDVVYASDDMQAIEMASVGILHDGNPDNGGYAFTLEDGAEENVFAVEGTLEDGSKFKGILTVTTDEDGAADGWEFDCTSGSWNPDADAIQPVLDAIDG